MPPTNTLTVQTPTTLIGWQSIAQLIVALAPLGLQIAIAISDAIGAAPHTTMVVGGQSKAE
jgi:hypothetical protein